MANRVSINIDEKAEKDLEIIQMLLEKLPYNIAKKYSNVSSISREGIRKVRKTLEAKVKRLENG